MQWDSTYGYYSNEADAFGDNNVSTSVLKATHNIKVIKLNISVCENINRL